MGFVKSVNENGSINLQVSFSSQKENSQEYFNGDSIKDALKYFNLEILDNELYLKNEGVFLNWQSGVTYTPNLMVKYKGKIYKVIREHTSQENLNPSISGDLFIRIFNKNSSIPEWKKPDFKNSYKKDSIVSYNGKFWKSMIEKNILEPEIFPQVWEEYIADWENGESYSFYQKVKHLNKVYLSLMPGNKEFPPTSRAWTIVEETKNEQEWERKDSGYQENEKVWYNGILYKSTMDNNFWSPEEYPDGWSSLEK